MNENGPGIHPGKPLIEARGLWRTYPDGNVNAVMDVTFQIAEGEYAAIVGPSGSGKSTLLNLLGALDRPVKGEVYFRGQPLGALKSLDDYRVRHVGFVFQSFLLLPTLTALENVQVPMFEGPRASPPSASAGLGSCWTRWAWLIGPIIDPRSYRWANGSAWPLPAPWPTNQRCFSPTSRPATSTRSTPPRCSTCSMDSTATTA